MDWVDFSSGVKLVVGKAIYEKCANVRLIWPRKFQQNDVKTSLIH